MLLAVSIEILKRIEYDFSFFNFVYFNSYLWSILSQMEQTCNGQLTPYKWKTVNKVFPTRECEKVHWIQQNKSNLSLFEVFYEMYFGIQVSEHFAILRLYWSESTLGPNWLLQKDVHPSEIYFSGMVSHLSSENWVEMSDLIHLKSIWVSHAKWMRISNGHNQMITKIWV